VEKGQMTGAHIISGHDSLTILAEAHLPAAVRFSLKVGELERTYAGTEDDRFEIQDCAAACIFADVAALEAYANELFFQPQTTFPHHPIAEIRDRWKCIQRSPIIDKFQCALSLWQRPRLDEGKYPTQDVALVIKLRNALVHFIPEWETKADEHRTLSANLKPKFTPSTIFEGGLLFPNRWATHSCLEWAIQSTLDFADYFEKTAAQPLPPRFTYTRRLLKNQSDGS
jgi:hypothetical protein